MREYKGKRREKDDRGVAERRGGLTSPGTQWGGGNEQPSVTPPDPGKSASPDPVPFKRNAKFSDLTFVTETNSQQVLAENSKRTYLAIQNRGSSAIFIGFGRRAGEKSFRLVAGGFYEPYIAPDSSVAIMGVAAGDEIVVIEGTTSDN